LGQLLALADDDLLAALARRGRAELARAVEACEPDDLRERCARAGLAVVCRHAPAYPQRLLDAADAPAVLHVAGDAAVLAGLTGDDVRVPAVAVVGARRATPHGLDVAAALGRGLAAADVAVVSGMALGIDSAAHAGALQAGGPTIAVLAGGADVPYPASKRSLYRRILAHGCVVAELPPGTQPMRWGFPARNRIIAALATATVVVEAAERSGSLITADIAADLGRAVGAVPGPVNTPRASGSNGLLHDGASVIRDARDALDLASVEAPRPSAVPRPRRPTVVARPPSPPHARSASATSRTATPGKTVDAPPLDPELELALEAIDDGADSADRLARVLGGDVARAAVVLTRLELTGVLRRGLDGRYTRGVR
jgi:DNA processing protein